MIFSYEDRIIKEGMFICEHGATVRATAKAFGISKSCVHKDMSKKLKHLDEDLYLKVRIVMQNNFATKHVRGGLATKNKFKSNRKK